MSGTEILAPAGSLESLKAAVNCGADAVYIGGKQFSARQNAANFDNAELKQAADLCHLHNIKIYLTVNTIIFDNQVNEFAEFIKNAANAGILVFFSKLTVSYLKCVSGNPVYMRKICFNTRRQMVTCSN